MLVFRWYKSFHDGFTNLKDGSRPGQLKTVITNANTAALLGLIKRDANFTVKKYCSQCWHIIGVSS